MNPKLLAEVKKKASTLSEFRNRTVASSLFKLRFSDNLSNYSLLRKTAAVSLNTLQARNRCNITTPKTQRSFESENGETLKKAWEELTSLLILESEGATMFPQFRYKHFRINI